VVGGRPIHPAVGRFLQPAVEVPAADDDRDVDALAADPGDLFRERARDAGIDPVVARAHEGFAGEFEEYAPERRSAHPASEKRWNSSTSAPASASTLPTDIEPSWIHGWSERAPPRSAKNRLFSMPSTIFSRACSGLDCTSSELR